MTLTQYHTLLPTYLLTNGLFTPQDVLVLPDWRCDSTCAQFVKHLSAHRLVPMVGLGRDVLSTGATFDIASHAGRNPVNPDHVQCSEISEKSTLFACIATRILLTLLGRYYYDINNTSTFFHFKIVTSTLLLSHYSSCDCFTDATILAQIGEVEQNFERYFSLLGRFWAIHTFWR